jgi:uncharacterized protein YbjT (DUF2867 family)
MAGKILVIGATGNVGKPLVRELVARGKRVKAATRRGTAIAGAEAVALDLADAATFPPALEDVDRIYMLVPGGNADEDRLISPLIELAAQRRLKIVLQTAIGVDAADDIPFRQAELLLETSGAPFAILRPNWFADNFHTWWRAGVRSGVIALPAANARTSFIDARDIAACAAALLTQDKFDGAAYTLTGPEALTYAEAAAILSKATGRTIAYVPSDDRSFVEALTKSGVSPAYAAFLASLFQPVRDGFTAEITDSVQALTGHPARPLARYAADHKAELS